LQIANHIRAMALKRFNVRVYGILINNNNEVLLADELIKGHQTTKFPGGGLELGEGLREGLAREFVEECQVKVEVGDHFYTTDFFVPSAFDEDSQIISVYYLCRCSEWRQIKASNTKFDYVSVDGKDAEAFRWVSMAGLHKETDVNLPIDKVVVQMLIEKLSMSKV
jgi:8-oxo-dGTP diphosphatase